MLNSVQRKLAGLQCLLLQPTDACQITLLNLLSGATSLHVVVTVTQTDCTVVMVLSTPCRLVASSIKFGSVFRQAQVIYASTTRIRQAHAAEIVVSLLTGLHALVHQAHWPAS